MAMCEVVGCTSEATELFESRQASAQWWVCQTHFLELGVSPFTTDAGGGLVVGVVGPPGVVSIEVVTGMGNASTVTFTLGYDGIGSQMVRFLLTGHDARDLCTLVAGSGHPFPSATTDPAWES